MKKSLRSQDKSIYLAFALSPSIAFYESEDLTTPQSKEFHFQLLKGNNDSMEGTELIEKTHSFGANTNQRASQMYLYLSLPQYAQKLHQTYSIKLVESHSASPQVLYEEPLDLNHYIHEHNTQEKDFWTEILNHSTHDYKLSIMQRVFLKSNRFELEDIINSSEIGEEMDVVDMPMTEPKSAKFGIDRRKSKSFQSSVSSFGVPRRLDTISEEESQLPLSQRKDKELIAESKIKLERFSASALREEPFDFETSLKKQSTWVEKNNNFDDEFFNAFDLKDQNGSKRSVKDKEDCNNNFLNETDFDHLRVKPLTESEISQKASKISKQTKDSQKQIDEMEISFLQKSSLLSDMEESELSISPDDEVCFKLKWIILIIIVLALAAVASLSTDAFDITDNKKHKMKSHKKKGDHGKGKSKPSKAPKNKVSKEVHA